MYNSSVAIWGRLVTIDRKLIGSTWIIGFGTGSEFALAHEATVWVVERSERHRRRAGAGALTAVDLSDGESGLLLAQTGLELYGYVPLGAGGNLEYRLYGGTIFIDLSSNPLVKDASVPYVAGGRLMWLTLLDALQVGGSLQALELKGNIFLRPEQLAAYQQANLLPAGFAGSIALTMPVLLWVASLEYAPGDWYLAAEYSRWNANGRTSPEVLTPDQRRQVSERFYVMGSYRVNSWFTPGIYYSGALSQCGETQRPGRLPTRPRGYSTL